VRLPHTPSLRKRYFQYLKYLTRINNPVHKFCRGTPARITIVVPCSVGDVAINSAITRSLRAQGQQAEITLLTDRKYKAISAFNPDYNYVAWLNDFTDKPPWALSYRDQLAAAKTLTPDMDLLYLCQPGGWCDVLFAKYHTLDLQHKLCGTPAKLRFHPQLTIPVAAAEKVCATWRPPDGCTIFIAAEAFTLKFGTAGPGFFNTLATSLAGSGWRVFWNGLSEPRGASEIKPGAGTITPVGHLPLAEVVALASMCQRAVSARSGLSDVIAFSAPGQPQYVLYPKTRYPYSIRSVRACYSLTKMGAANVKESENSLDSVADMTSELAKVWRWLDTAP
jgi:hypothetical protein